MWFFCDFAGEPHLETAAVRQQVYHYVSNNNRKDLQQNPWSCIIPKYVTNVRGAISKL